MMPLVAKLSTNAKYEGDACGLPCVPARMGTVLPASELGHAARLRAAV